MKKKLTLLFLSIYISLLSISSVFAVKITSRDLINVMLNNEIVEFDQPPIIENGRTLVPFRAILEAMGVYVKWNEKTKTIICQKDNTNVFLPIGENYIKINGKETPLDVPARITNGRTLVPLRAISESLGADVYWQEKTRTVQINTDYSDSINYDSDSKTEDFIESTVSSIISQKSLVDYDIAYFAIYSNIDKIDDISFEKFKASNVETDKLIFNIFSTIHKFMVNYADVSDKEDFVYDILVNCDESIKILKNYKKIYDDIAAENGIYIDYDNDYGDDIPFPVICDEKLDLEVNNLINYAYTLDVDENELYEFFEIRDELIVYELDILRKPYEINSKKDEINSKYKENIEKMKSFIEKYDSDYYLYL